MSRNVSAVRGRKAGKRRRRLSWEKYLSADPGQLMLPISWSELDEKGRLAAEAAARQTIAEVQALTTTAQEEQSHGEK